MAFTNRDGLRDYCVPASEEAPRWPSWIWLIVVAWAVGHFVRIFS